MSQKELEQASPWKRLESKLPGKKVVPQDQERLNRFERNDLERVSESANVPKPASIFSDDRQTSWTRNTTIQTARREYSDAHEVQDRESIRQKQRESWISHGNHAPRTARGLAMGPELVKLKAKSDADRVSRRQPKPHIVIDADVVRACILLWRSETEDGRRLYEQWEESVFTKTSLNNAIQMRLAGGQPVNPQLVQDSYADCVNGNHLERKVRRDANGNVVRHRSEAALPAPTIYPRPIFGDEIAANEQAAHEAAVEAATKEMNRALSIPFTQLKREVQAQRKSEKP